MTFLRLDASDFRLALDGSLSDWRDGLREGVMRAGRETMKETGEYAKSILRADLREAGLGALEKSWQYELYPRTGLSDNPALWIYSKAEVIVRAFDEGATIRPVVAGMLAIPIPGSHADDLRNPKGPGTKVDEAKRRFGEDRLFIIPATANRPALLAVRGVGLTPKGRLNRFNKTKTGKFRKGTQTVPLFFLVPQARLEKRLDVQGNFDRIGEFLVDRYPENVRRELAAAGYS